ncbi:MAG: PQQ-dependent sugar dehydrogenase [Candidatus Eisenbacteria bacterium]|uniref:PQQ-dependent sugar dehydrogenase n=1 Tax=Eiseniibacteriota bacterium TaxID=2212470 RepID=A0A9D6L525_UNCEI|nr:PQQ-dependent sugar dehydrogenase [Candidatus Eisenbacteria bacterium]
MRHPVFVAIAAAFILAAPARADAPAPAAGLALERVAGGLDRPLFVTAPAGDPRLFIVEQGGRVRIVRNGTLLPRPFLDIRDRVRAGGERGLLSLAFHPRYARNGFFYVNYTDLHGDTRVERYAVGADPDRADPASARLVLHVDQPFANHNGGLVMFGPDGMLYVGMGDGGSGGDPFGNGQKLGTLLGKLLRLDVDAGEPYRIPRGNPFAGRPGARPEIWALGLRNPWRFCFDHATGALVIADVGQNRWEEVDAAPAANPGLNYGWNVMEGDHCYGRDRCDTAGLTRPALEYGHGDGCSIIGGFVYRGTRMPALAGRYLYSDYCGGWIRSVRIDGGGASESREWSGLHVPQVTSFGEDATGELYVCSQTGDVYRLVMRAGR